MTDHQQIREALELSLKRTDLKYEHPFIKQALAALSRLEAAAAPELSREVLPHWEPCNPGCDPEFNGERTAYCGHLCKGAREALHAAALARSAPVGEVKPMTNAEIAELAETISDDEIMHHWNRRDAALHGKNAVIWFARAVIGAHLKATPPAPPEGWKLVPVEPTTEMLEAMSEVDATPDKILRLIYKSGIAAAPQPGDKT